MKRLLRRKTIVVGAALAALAAAGIAYATIPDANGVYTACKLNATGTIRLIDPSLPTTSLLQHCTSLETRISWNQQGPAGPAGKDGSNGTNGTNGVSGYEVVTSSADSATVGKSVGDAISYTLGCPAGKKVLGAGYGGDWGAGASGAPSPDGTTFTVNGIFRAGTSLSIWVACVVV